MIPLSCLTALSLFLYFSSYSAVYAETSNPDSVAWLYENSKKEGVKILASGLQYKVIKSGNGKDHPSYNSHCEIHYSVKDVNGTEFESSYGGKPHKFAPQQALTGWSEVLALMVEGDVWELYIPSELATGDKEFSPGIKEGNAAIFTLELTNILGSRVPKIDCNVMTLENCDKREKEYIETLREKCGDDVDALEAELEEIQVETDTPKAHSPYHFDWLRRRVNVLTNLIDKALSSEL